MGTWSHEPFGNDTANDWAYDLEKHKDFTFVEAALDNVLSVGNDYLRARIATQAIAAVEVIAKALGKGTQSDSYTKKVDKWLKKTSAKPSADLLSKAGRALDRVTSTNSEIQELWQDSDDADSWAVTVGALRAAVGA
jgi:poly-gamma-glutamate capsule biosynthesis protein CapA/YwtB (metallophosphatase superfamily)